jgi:hypothetical protein
MSILCVGVSKLDFFASANLFKVYFGGRCFVFHALAAIQPKPKRRP